MTIAIHRGRKRTTQQQQNSGDSERLTGTMFTVEMRKHAKMEVIRMEQRGDF